MQTIWAVIEILAMRNLKIGQAEPSRAKIGNLCLPNFVKYLVTDLTHFLFEHSITAHI
jgi:hypothetical protein